MAKLTPNKFGQLLKDYFTIQNVYSAAIKEMSTKLEILDSEFHFRYKRNPIHNIQTRLKSPQSIFNKLLKKGLDSDIKTITESITDIAGIRVICQYIDDIYTIADLLTNQDDVTVVKVSDYIKRPKENGYRSLHLVVNVPVFLSDGKENVNVEIQIRTIAMDYWASLEHELKYKNPEEVPAEMKAKLLECAETIAETDRKMQDIYRALSKLHNNGEE
ncbi:MAG: GTP pyrophosphokinase family protein [Clostridia bacterium]|nr:GTP pyrophosphokinase family protein [Clostridia bacterium]